MDVLHWLYNNHELAINGALPGIIPTVLIPLTALTVGISSLAAMVAGWFGIKLHTEGPKQLLEVLLKKRVLIVALILNLAGWGVYKGYRYLHTLPSFIKTISNYSKENATPSAESYSESRTRPHDFVGSITPANISSLTLNKEIKIPRGAFRSGAISGNSIFFGVDDGYIYEFDKNTLDTKRKFFIGTQVTTRPVIYQGKIYAGEGNHETHHARIYSFDLKQGTFQEAFETKGHTEGQPVIATFEGQDLMFVAAGSDGLHAINPTTMKAVWHQRDGHLDATVSIENGVVFAGFGVEKGNSKDKTLAVAYDFLTGKQIWKKELPLSNWMHPIVTINDVCYVLGEIYIPSTVGLFYCLDKKDGTPHFSIPFDAPIASKPVYLREGNEEYAFFGNLRGEICGVSINQREKIWCHQTAKKTIKSSLSSFEYDAKRGVLWYPTFDNGILAIEPKTGKTLLHWTPSKTQAEWKASYGAISVGENQLYHLDIKGNLRMFQIN